MQAWVEKERQLICWMFEEIEITFFSALQNSLQIKTGMLKGINTYTVLPY